MNNNSGQFGRIYCFKDRKVLKGSAKATKKLKALNSVLDEKDLSNLLWWNERMQACRKPSTLQLVKRLEYSNLLGLDVNLKSGSELLHYLTVILSRFLMALRSTCQWGEFGEGGMLWGECASRHYEWFEGNPVTELLSKVKELYGLDDETAFRNVTVSSENRPRALTLGTTTQIGLPVLYVRDLPLNPPAYEIASSIQAFSYASSPVHRLVFNTAVWCWTNSVLSFPSSSSMQTYEQCDMFDS
ncbi:hypothetical protein FNV43_RR02214 [Rhamnella rubrinervis]|uniref:Uncharacterized protein n=1 Tax=Rhamnella rubrinervis TaxID=2594499 RepID=A0A8K0HRY8_9ROSA|nr:hypothetical protein FNV43_RR02214 [Rhamnella rubrinervis]